MRNKQLKFSRLFFKKPILIRVKKQNLSKKGVQHFRQFKLSSGLTTVRDMCAFSNILFYSVVVKDILLLSTVHDGSSQFPEAFLLVYKKQQFFAFLGIRKQIFSFCSPQFLHAWRDSLVAVLSSQSRDTLLCKSHSHSRRFALRD